MLRESTGIELQHDLKTDLPYKIDLYVIIRESKRKKGTLFSQGEICIFKKSMNNKETSNHLKVELQANQSKQVQVDGHNDAIAECHPSPWSPVCKNQKSNHQKMSRHMTFIT